MIPIPANGQYQLFGWRVASELPLPELLPWSGDERAVDITIRIGEVPDQLPAAQIISPFVQIAGRTLARLAVKGVGCFLIRDGCDITLAPDLPLDAPDLGLFLLGSALGILCLQRQRPLLHASAVELDGQVFAFAGPSGVGKSTLAAALVARGGRLLADDLTLPDLILSGGGVTAPPTVPVGIPRFKLWRDSLTALELTAQRRLRRPDNFEKFEVRTNRVAPAPPRPLAALCHLSPVRRPGLPILAPITGTTALALIHRHLYRRQLALKLLDPSFLFRWGSALALSVPQFQLHRPCNLTDLPAFTDQVPALLRDHLR